MTTTHTTEATPLLTFTVGPVGVNRRGDAIGAD